MKYSSLRDKQKEPVNWRSHSNVFKQRLFPRFMLDKLLILIKDVNALPAQFANTRRMST